jgi:hypothetical protein
MRQLINAYDYEAVETQTVETRACSRISTGGTQFPPLGGDSRDSPPLHALINDSA